MTDQKKPYRRPKKKYSRYCFSIAWNVLYDKEDSDECVNDTWLATWNSIPPRKTGNSVCFSWKNNPKPGNWLFSQEKSCKTVNRAHIRIMQRTGRDRGCNSIFFEWWNSEKRDSGNSWKISGIPEKRWLWHFYTTLLVYGQHQRNFSPSWNFRKQNQIQASIEAEKT